LNESWGKREVKALLRRIEQLRSQTRRPRIRDAVSGS
jgi:hypothetical protein